jgi:sulfur carrier protein
MAGAVRTRPVRPGGAGVRVEVNGTTRELGDGVTIAELIETLAGSTRGRAVVVDGAVVPRSQWPEYPLRDGQAVELITAVPGG